VVPLGVEGGTTPVGRLWQGWVAPWPQPLNRAFRWLWLGQLISNLGTQCSLYGIGLWSFGRQGQLLDFAAVAFVVQLAKVLVVPVLGRRLCVWPRPQVMLVANGVGALCTLAMATQLLHWQQTQLLVVLPLLALAAMAEAALVLSFASVIPQLVVDPARLAQANGMFVTADGLVFSVAPYAGSWLVASAGLPGVLLLDGCTFVIAMLCVLLARTPARLRQPMVYEPPPPGRLRFAALLAGPTTGPVLVLGTAMAFVYAATEVLFPAWLMAAALADRTGLAFCLGVVGYLMGYVVWSRWAWRVAEQALMAGLLLQAIVLAGASLQWFQGWLLGWSAGIVLFSAALPPVLAALQGRWQRSIQPSLLPLLLAYRYRAEWIARLVAFAGVAALVDGLLKPMLAASDGPHGLVVAAVFGQGAARSMPIGLGVVGVFLGCVVLSQWRAWFRPLPSVV